MVEFFFLIFPAATLFAGAALILRGMKKFNGKPAFSGKVELREKVRSSIGSKECCYSKLVVECYQGDRKSWQPWSTILQKEEKVPFIIGGKLLDPEFSDVRLSKAEVFSGRIMSAMGELDRFLYNAKNTPTLSVLSVAYNIASSVMGQDEESGFINESVVSELLKIPGLNKTMEPHMKKRLRISQYTIVEGDLLSVGSESLKGTPTSPLLITDSTSDEASSLDREKGITGMAVGCLLILLSAGLLYVLVAAL